MAVNYPGNHVEMTWSDMFLFPLNKGEQWCMEISWLAELRQFVSPPHGSSGLRWSGFLGVRYGFYFFFPTDDRFLLNTYDIACTVLEPTT